MSRILFQAVALSALALVASAAAPLPADLADLAEPAVESSSSACALPETPAPQRLASSSWTFEGCFAYFAAGTCFDVYRDDAGTLWICRVCGTTTKPGRGQCNVLTATGFWCS